MNNTTDPPNGNSQNCIFQFCIVFFRFYYFCEFCRGSSSGKGEEQRHKVHGRTKHTRPTTSGEQSSRACSNEGAAKSFHFGRFQFAAFLPASFCNISTFFWTDQCNIAISSTLPMFYEILINIYEMLRKYEKSTSPVKLCKIGLNLV